MMPACHFCGKQVGEECYCHGCKHYVCSDCDFGMPMGDHVVEDHENEGDEP